MIRPLPRERGVLFIIAAAFLAGMAVSFPLWIGPRLFPVVPVIGGFTVPSAVTIALSSLLVASLVVLCLRPRSEAVWVVIGLTIVLCVLDIERFQPWVYQYVLLLGVFVCLPLSSRLTVCRWLLGVVYIWSALHKITPSFFETIVPFFAPSVAAASIGWVGSAMIVVELGIGLGLLWRKTATSAALAAIGVHLCILLVLSPLVRNWNAVVWPWNVALPLLAVLCARGETVALRAVMRNAYAMALVLLVGIGPLLGLFGWWHAYPSFMLYTGNVDTATVTMAGTVRSVSAWSMDALHVPAYPDAFAYRQLLRTLCRDALDPHRLFLFVHRRRTLLRARQIRETYRCSDVL